MPLLDFEKIVQQASPLAEELCLHLMGEPLFHPEFEEIIQTCESHNTKVQLTTNGTLIKKYQDFLFSSKMIRQVNFSLQSLAESYPKKLLETHLESILQFSKEAQTRRPDLYINFRLWNIKNDLEKTQKENEFFYCFIERDLNLTIKRNIDVGGIKSKKLMNKIYLHFDSRFDWPRYSLPYQGETGRCNALIDHIAIHSDGTVVPCCLDDQALIPLGNCLNEPLKSILLSSRAIKMKEGFENGRLVEELCQHCTYINRFKKKKRLSTEGSVVVS